MYFLLEFKYSFLRFMWKLKLFSLRAQLILFMKDAQTHTWGGKKKVKTLL